MGSKMSFGRGSSDQNTMSELTSATPVPLNSCRSPSDYKQMPNNNGCSEGELNRGDKMKAADLHQSNSSEHLESDANVISETAGKTNSQQSEHVSSQVTSKSNSATDSQDNPVEVRRKPGRPRKRKRLWTDGRRGPNVSGPDVVRHKELSTTQPLPTCSTNHSTDDVPNAVDGHLKRRLRRTATAGPNVVLNDIAGSGVALAAPKKRGRPKKSETAALRNSVSKTVAACPAAVSNPVWKLRSRGGQHLSTQGEMPDLKEDPKQTEVTPPENSSASNCQGVKRRRSKCHTYQQVPEKVSKLDDSQEASPELSDDKNGGGRAEVDEPVEVSIDTQETNTDGNPDQSPLLSENVEEQQVQVKDVTLPQPELESQPDPEISPSEDLNSFNLLNTTEETKEPNIKESVNMNNNEEPLSKTSDLPVNVELQRDEPSCTDVVTSTEETPESVETPSAVEAENVDLEVDESNLVSQSNSPKTVQSDAKSTVKPEYPNVQQKVFRRKRGGKRRRRISNVLIQKENLTEKHDAAVDTQPKTDCGDVTKEANCDDNTNIIYTKRGSKTLLKCGYCGRVFKFLSQFVIHQRIHTGERPFKCSECGKGFSKNSNLNLHLKTHKKNNMYQKCRFCKLRFSSSEYTSHMKTHANELELESSNIKSEKQSQEVSHENIQAPPKPATQEKKEKKVCQYCGKTFPFQSALVRHVRVHTGEKPYKCDICGKAFGQAYFLRVHELTHWSVKRYNCTRCEKSFTHYSNAKNHTCRPVEGFDASQTNRRIKPSLTYTCHICKNIFDHLQVFNSHMKEHTGARLYRCLYCDKLFGTLSEFHSHRSRCTSDRHTSSHSIKEEETMTLIQYSVPSLRCSSGPNSTPVTSHCEMQKTPSQISHKRRSANLKKPFLSTVIPPHQISHLVLKLNKLDNRSDPRKYLCPKCGRQFRHMGRLRAHMLTHAPGQSYTCACCGKTLGSWRKLWYHQRIHRQRSGRFTCPQCGRGFRFVGPYKKHMNEHPDFHWIQNRPTKTFLPYQCDQCRCSFKTLDLLFGHQLCHSSTQDVRKDTDFDLLIEDRSSQANKKIASSPSNNSLATSSAERISFSSSLSDAYPEPTCERSPLLPTISSVHSQSLNLDNSAGRTQLAQDKEPRPDRVTENVPINRRKTCLNQSSSKSNEGSSGDVNCAVCGSTFPAISDLYHHYLQHARGEV